MGFQDFTLVNALGFNIHAVYVSAADDESWEEDVLGRDVLEDGEQVDISFSGNEDQELWDLKIRDFEGEEFYWRGLNLGVVSEVTIHWDGRNATATTA